jgi:hypothetical protein
VSEGVEAGEGGCGERGRGVEGVLLMHQKDSFSA